MRKTNNTPGISEKLDSIISRLDRFRRQAFWLVVIVFAATIVLGVINLNASSDPPYLILTLNILFVGVPCLFFAGIAANSFVRTGVWPAIWLGAGSLAFGLAVLLSGPLQTFSTINSTITIHNILTLIGGVLILIGAFFVINRIPPYTRENRRWTPALQIYISVLAVMAFIIHLGLSNRLPPFFIGCHKLVKNGVGPSIRKLTILKMNLSAWFLIK
jgi:cell division protein FtsW (lipid II flippase)